MSKENLRFEIRILQVAKVLCYTIAAVAGMGALLPFAVSLLAPETETMEPLLRVVAISIVSGIILFLFSATAGRIDKLICFRKKEYENLLALEQKKLIEKRIAARKAAKSHT